MIVNRLSLEQPDTPATLDWKRDILIDRMDGTHYFPEYNRYPPDRDMPAGLSYRFGHPFDRAIFSPNGQFLFIYANLGTKGLLIRNGNKIIREINRSYYHAHDYEYPATFITIGDRTFLVHCPQEYCRLDFEDVETGEIITQHPDRAPGDFFHSRLEISPGNRYLVSKGWVWHPLNLVMQYDIAACLQNPLLLDQGSIVANFSFEINTASFIDGTHLLVGTGESINDSGDDSCLQEGPLGIWDMEKREITHSTPVDGPIANLIAINASYAWDLYEYPKLINIRTGQIEWKAADIASGKQSSSIGGEHKIELLHLSPETAAKTISH